MKHKLVAFLSGIFLLSALTVPALGANRVPELTVDVALRPDGSACITQEFWAETDEGTEFYLDCLDSGYLYITDFSVSDINGPYTVLKEGTWDIDASFEEKAGKCGILPIDGGVELCWGITQYGQYRYAVEYILHNLAGSYEDADGFNHRFVNADMGFFPTDVVLTIRNQDGTPITDEQADIWAFGFDGQIIFDDGVIRAWTESPLEDESNMTVMVCLNKGVLSPEREGEGTFEEVKERAFEGSDYEENLTPGEILALVIAIAVLIIVIAAICIIVYFAGKAKRKKKELSTPYFRDSPNGGDLNITYILGSRLNYTPDDTLIGARILRLLAMGCLEPLVLAPKAKNVPLKLVRAPRNGDVYDETLYNILQTAAGENGVLEPKELEHFCAAEDHAPRLASLMDSCERSGVTKLIQSGCLCGAKCESAKDLTQKGNVQLNELLGLKRYLQEFSLLDERSVIDTVLWQDYMVYAMLFGIAEQVTRQLRTLYPAQLPRVRQYECYVSWCGHYNTLLYSAIQQERTRQEAARNQGSGGSASFFGGGGFSGGGGGGTR